MRIELTKKQTKLLQRHFQAVANAYRAGERGMLIAQIRDCGWPEGPHMMVGFLTKEECQPLVWAGTTQIPRVPLGWGIPSHLGKKGDAT